MRTQALHPKTNAPSRITPARSRPLVTRHPLRAALGGIQVRASRGMPRDNSPGLASARGADRRAALDGSFAQVPVHSGRPPPIQAKLMLGRTADRHEQEADRAADRVVSMPAPPTPTFPRGAGGFPGARPRPDQQPWAKGTDGPAPAPAPATVAPPLVREALRAPGEPLSPAARAFFEPRFGHDFSRVSIHADSRASRAARAMGARAFTVGPHIAFREGQYAPQSDGGRRLLAHELAHVVQQSGGAPQSWPGTPALGGAHSGVIQRNPSIPDFLDIARRLRTAMQGLGTDEAAIVAALGELGGDRAAGEELKRVYQGLYGSDLETELRSELSGADLTRADALLNPAAAPAPAASAHRARLSRLQSKVRSIDKDGTATISLHPDPATGKVRGYQLHQTFRVEFDPAASASDYAVIQWIKGELYETRGTNRVYWPASMGLYGRGSSQAWRFTDWIIDSPDADPRFGSDRGVAVSVPTTRFDDAPGVIQNSGPLPAGLRFDVDARVGIYPWGSGIPKYIAGWESQRPRPFVEKAWGWDIEVDAAQTSLNVTIS